MTVQYREFEAFTAGPISSVSTYQTYAEWGADIVIGTAEHKPMTFEFYQTRRGEDRLHPLRIGQSVFRSAAMGQSSVFPRYALYL